MGTLGCRWRSLKNPRCRGAPFQLKDADDPFSKHHHCSHFSWPRTGSRRSWSRWATKGCWCRSLSRHHQNPTTSRKCQSDGNRPSCATGKRCPNSLETENVHCRKGSARNQLRADAGRILSGYRILLRSGTPVWLRAGMWLRSGMWLRTGMWLRAELWFRSGMRFRSWMRLRSWMWFWGL
jgi:hypothetical protein